MRQIIPWMVAAILALPGATAPMARPETGTQSQQDQKPPDQQQDQQQPNPTPGAVQGSSSPQSQNPPAQAPPQQNSPQKNPAPKSQQNPPTIRVGQNAVLVPVTVKDSKGQLVSDLDKDEFRIFDNGKEQIIRQFSTDPVPLSVVVLLDNEMTLKVRDQVQKSLESIAAAMGPSDETALMRFWEFPEPLSDFTKNNDVLFTELHRLRLGEDFPGDATGPMTAGPTINNQSQEPQVPLYGMKQEKVVKDLDDAVHGAAEALRARCPVQQGRKQECRKIIFLVADGQNSRHNKWTYKQTLDLLLSSEISVYTITAGSALYFKHEPGHMTKYATDTGGDSYFASKEDDLERLYSDVTEEARNQYMLTFYLDNPAPGEFHTIEVRVEQRGLNVSARQGYYVQGK